MVACVCEETESLEAKSGTVRESSRQKVRQELVEKRKCLEIPSLGIGLLDSGFDALLSPFLYLSMTQISQTFHKSASVLFLQKKATQLGLLPEFLTT